VHSRSTAAMGRLTILLLVILTCLALVAAVMILVRLPGPPTLRVSNVYLSSNSVTQNTFTTFSFTISNNDAAKPHQVKVVFKVNSLVTFYQDNASLPKGNDGLQYSSLTLQPSEQSTFPLKVTGTLTGGASSTTYSIQIDFFDENSTRFDTEAQSLTINQ
jgi:hypothetical protein